MVVRMTVGLVLTAVALAIAGRRLWWLKRLAFSGQPAPDRVAAVRSHPGRDAEVQATEVIGQRKLLKWSVPGAAHAATFWGFIVLLLTIIEAYGALFSRTFAIPGLGHWAFVGFIEDLFAVGVLAGIITFTVIRIRNNPRKEGRKSRFFGSHTRAAWVVLGMIFLVIATLLLYRGAQINTGVFPYAHGAFASEIVAHWLAPLGYGVNSVLEAAFMLAQIAVIMAFAVIVVYSKHLHIVVAPVNVMFSRRPDALGPLEPMRSGGKVLDFEEADPDTDVFGLGKIEDFTWKGLLDMATCTECGRCQSQCPAWATGKPLSPKQVILDLRDHAFAKAPYLLAASDEEREKLPDAVKSRGGAAAGRHQGGRRGDRPGRAVVVHELRGLRGGVPGGHRAHRPHRRDAAPPGADRVRVPGRGGGDAAEPGEQGRPVGHGRGPPRRLDRRARLRGPRGRREDRPRRRVPVLGRLRRGAGGPGEEDHQGHRDAAAPGRA